LVEVGIVSSRAHAAAGGGDAVGWDVTVDIDVLLKREEAEAVA
jgi:hypothetical protein